MEKNRYFGAWGRDARNEQRVSKAVGFWGLAPTGGPTRSPLQKESLKGARVENMGRGYCKVASSRQKMFACA